MSDLIGNSKIFSREQEIINVKNIFMSHAVAYYKHLSHNDDSLNVVCIEEAGAMNALSQVLTMYGYSQQYVNNLMKIAYKNVNEGIYEQYE